MDYYRTMGLWTIGLTDYGALLISKKHRLSADLKMFDIFVNDNNGEWAGVQGDKVVNILRVEIIQLIKVVIVGNERNTEYKILSKLQYLHSTACEQSSSSSSSTINKDLTLKTLVLALRVKSLLAVLDDDDQGQELNPKAPKAFGETKDLTLKAKKKAKKFTQG